MNSEDLKQFLERHDLSNVQFAELLGVTPCAVQHWLNGIRSISLTVGRLCKLFDKRPVLLDEFKS